MIMHCEYTPNVDISLSSSNLINLDELSASTTIKVPVSESSYASNDSNNTRFAHLENGSIIFTGAYTKGKTYNAEFCYLMK